MRLWLKLWIFRFIDGSINLFKSIKGWIANSDGRLRGPDRLLMNAARAGQVWKIKHLVAAGARLNCLDSRGMTPLLVSIDRERSELFLVALINTPEVVFEEVVSGLRMSQEQDRLPKHPLLRAIIRGRSPEVINAMAARCDDAEYLKSVAIPAISQGAYDFNPLAPSAIRVLLECRVREIEDISAGIADNLISIDFGSEAQEA